MCVAAPGSQTQSSGKRTPPGSAGHRLDMAQRKAGSTSGGGTIGRTILKGQPNNSGVDALRKTTTLGV